MFLTGQEIRGDQEVQAPSRLSLFLRRRLGMDPRNLLIKVLPKGSRGAEIGVWKGDFSRRLVDNVAPSALYLVDPWIFCGEFSNRWYGGAVAKNQGDMDDIHRAVQHRFDDNDIVFVVRKTSIDFFEQFEDGPLDWVYVDGDHGETAVYKDIVGAWNVIRDGGIVAGDDFFWKDEAGTEAVKSAVTKFCRDKNVGFRLFGNQFLIRRNDCSSPQMVERNRNARHGHN